MQWDLITAANLLTFVQGMLLGLFFLFRKKGIRQANWFLGLFLLVFNFSDLHAFFMGSGLVQQYLWLLVTPSLFLFTYGPLLYHYTRSLVKPSVAWQRRDWLLYVPVLLDVFANTALMIAGPHTAIRWMQTESIALLHHVYSFSASLYAIYLTIKALQLIPASSDRSGGMEQKVQWLHYFLYSYLIRFSFWSFYFFLVLSIGWWVDIPSITDAVVMFLTIMDTVSLYWISFFMIAHNQQLHQAEQQARPAPYPYRQEPQLEDAAYKKLLQLLEEEALYKKADLRISELAERLDTNTKYLSQLINSKSGLNFNGLINRYRVEAVKLQMQEKSNQHLTLAALAEACGFASASTFSRAFKQETGMLPKEYQQQIMAKA